MSERSEAGVSWYPQGVVCPNCGADIGERCEYTDSDGRTGLPTVVPHEERHELARELALSERGPEQ